MKQFALVTERSLCNCVETMWRRWHNPHNIDVIYIETKQEDEFRPDGFWETIFQQSGDSFTIRPPVSMFRYTNQNGTPFGCIHATNASLVETDAKERISWLLEGTSLCPEERRQMVHDAMTLDVDLFCIDEITEGQVIAEDNKNKIIISSKHGRIEQNSALSKFVQDVTSTDANDDPEVIRARLEEISAAVAISRKEVENICSLIMAN